MPLPIIYEALPGPNGRTYRVISLEGVLRRGQRMEYRSERDLEGFFKESRENVSVSVEVPTDSLTLSVTWPSDRKPQQLTVERSGRTPKSVSPTLLKRVSGGRVMHDETVTDPRLGEKITISWLW